MHKYFLLKIYFILLLGTSLTYSQKLNNKSPILKRKLAYPDSTVYLPYTNLCFIQGSQMTTEHKGWIIDNEIEVSEEKSLLFIEMNSSQLPKYKYSDGDVQLVIEVPQFKNNYEFDIVSNKVKVSLVNHYGGFKAKSELLEGNLSLIKVNHKIKISGKVILKRVSPNTEQIIEFSNNIIPSYNLQKFLVKYKKQKSKFKKQTEEKFKNSLKEYLNSSKKRDRLSIIEKEIDLSNKLNDKQNIEHSFKFIYSTVGLGSNRWKPAKIIVMIKNSILSYGLIELSDEIKSISFATGDTTWKKKRIWYDVPFAMSSKDSILNLLYGKENQYIFQTHPLIMSGEVQEIYIEYNGWCIKFELKNACNKLASSIISLLNSYLPTKHKIYEKTDEKYYDEQLEPFIKECTGNNNKSYKEVLELEDEYESIRKSEK